MKQDPAAPSGPPPGSDELLRLMVESAVDYAIFTTDPDGIVTSWNTGAERVLGYPEAEILGQTSDVIFPPELGGGKIGRQEREAALRDGRAADERWHMRRDGSRFWASGLMMPLSAPDAGFVKILRDYTQYHCVEQRLRASEERFRLLATNIPQLVFRSQPDGTRTWGSPQWVEFTGLTLGESVGHGWLKAVHSDDLPATMAAWEDAARSGEYYVEHRIRRASDGAWRWHQTRARPIQGDPGNLDWVGTTTDIHDLRYMHDRQQVMMAELQHRTRNLIAVTQAIAGQTMRSSRSLTEFRPQFESRLRSLSRVQALLARSNHESIDLRELLQAELTAHAGSQSDRIQIEGPVVALPPIAAQALGLALHELSTNAVKYGALTQPAGHLAVTWLVEPKRPYDILVLNWIEGGVQYPGGTLPTGKGYGTHLIERALPYQLNARTRIEFGPDGVRCEIAVPLEPNPGDDLGLAGG